MTRPRILRLAVAAAALGMIALLADNRAEADIRLTLTTNGGLTTTQLFASGNDLATATINFGDYLVVLNTVSTNAPGDTLGSLTTTAQIATIAGSGPVSALTILSEVVVGTTALSPRLQFTSPTPGAWSVRTDITGTTASSVTTGSVTGTTFVNGTGVAVTTVALPNLQETANTGQVATPPLNSYTLANTMVISNVPHGISRGQIGISLTSEVTAVVPEPATVALALTGVPVLGLFWARRRRRQS